jgi:hypothetical protein
MSIPTLQAAAHSLERSLDRLEHWLAVMTALVVVGLVLEYWHELPHAIAVLKKAKKCLWKPILIIGGAILITVGVGGELVVQFFASNVETNLRQKNDEIFVTLNNEAEQLRTDGEIAHKQTDDERMARVKIEQAVAWRTFDDAQQTAFAASLKPFAGPLADCSFMGGDTEAFSFSSDIAAALRRAKWKVVPPSPNMLEYRLASPPNANSAIVRVETGVETASTSEVGSIAAAKAIAKELQHLGFDAEFSPTKNVLPQPMVWIRVLHRPLGAQGEAKLTQKKQPPSAN